MKNESQLRGNQFFLIRLLPKLKIAMVVQIRNGILEISTAPSTIFSKSERVATNVTIKKIATW